MERHAEQVMINLAVYWRPIWGLN